MKSITFTMIVAAFLAIFTTSAFSQQQPGVGAPWDADGKLFVDGDKFFGMQAGPIWNNGEAPAKCAAACEIEWNGGWVTVIEGEMSICAGHNMASSAQDQNILAAGGVAGGLEAGPIWNNDEAQAKCEAAFATVEWVTDNWITYEPGKASACACRSTEGHKVRTWLPNNVEQ